MGGMFRTVACVAVLVCFDANSAPIDKCSDVLVPFVRVESGDYSRALSIVNLLESDTNNERTRNISLNIPIPVEGGPPLVVGFSNGQSNRDASYLKRYNNYSETSEESFYSLSRSFNDGAIGAWSDCMKNRNGFYFYAIPETRTDTSISMLFGNFMTGNNARGILALSLTNATYQEKSQHEEEITETGNKSFSINIDPNKKAVVTATYQAQVLYGIVLPEESLLPINTPVINYRVRGMLQNRPIDQVKATPNFDVSANALFASNQVVFTIEQYVDGKLCASKTISSQHLGDLMDRIPQWSMGGMNAGCQSTSKPHTYAFECFVDPVHPNECIK